MNGTGIWRALLICSTPLKGISPFGVGISSSGVSVVTLRRVLNACIRYCLYPLLNRGKVRALRCFCDTCPDWIQIYVLHTGQDGGFAYTNVGKGREQGAEASSNKAWFLNLPSQKRPVQLSSSLALWAMNSLRPRMNQLRSYRRARQVFTGIRVCLLGN